MGLLSPVLKAKRIAGLVHQWTIAYMRIVGSIRLAVVLWMGVILAVVWSKILSDRYGFDYAKWHVLHTYWFTGLLIALADNALCLVGRILLKKQVIGFNVLHFGFLLLVGGIAYSFFGSTEGTVSLSYGDVATRMTMRDTHEIRVNWSNQPQERPYVFTFEPAAIDWLEKKPFEIGEVDGVGLTVLRFMHQATPTVDWIADKTGRGGPALKLKLSGGNQIGAMEKHLPDEQFGDETFIGPIRLQLQQARCSCRLEDFLNPPVELGPSGQLVVMYKDHLQRVEVEGNIGKRISLEDTKIAVEIVEYLPDARPDALGGFRSRSTEPKNPLLELKVYLPEEPQPKRQLAFAKSPLTNLDGVYGMLPVEFRYYHPKASPQTGVELLQSIDQRLYARVISGDKVEPLGEVKKESQIKLPAGFELSISEYLPCAARNIQFDRSYSSPQSLQSDSAALVEISTGGITEKVWVQRNSPLYGMRVIDTPQGPLALRYGNKMSPLGFQLALPDLSADTNDQPISASTVVRLIDQADGIDTQHEITSTRPLVHKGFCVSLASDADAAASFGPLKLHIAYVPGGWLKCSGTIIMAAGLLAMITSRFFHRVPAVDDSRMLHSSIDSH